MLSSDESARREEIGDVLFSMVNVVRFLGYNPEEILQENIRKFSKRFVGVEKMAESGGKEMADYSGEELEHFWGLVKGLEHSLGSRD